MLDININTPQNLQGLIANTGKVSGTVKNAGNATGRVSVGNVYMNPIVVDDCLSNDSTNPVQNKVITAEVENINQQMKDVETLIGNVDVLLGII